MRKQIHEFFEVLARELNQPARVILIGAAAGALWGSVRPSQDVDFEIQVTGPSPSGERGVQRAIQRAVEATGIQANYAEEIGRWGMISLADYRRHTVLYRRFGKLELRLLDPAYWAIGKLDRYVQSDVQDLLFVLRKRKPSPDHVAQVWGRALRQSPLSETKLLFRRHVEHFLRAHGREIWGKRLDPASAIQAFHRHAGVSV